MADNNTKSPVPFVRPQYFDANGAPLALGKLYTYAAGGTTPLATYTTPVGDVANDNPIVLDSAGRPSKNNAGVGVNLSPASYHLILKDAAENTIFDEDNVWTPTSVSDIYTPIGANFTNIVSVTFDPARYFRVGNIVRVSGQCFVTTTAAGGASTQFSMTLPIASDLAGSNSGGGIAYPQSTAQQPYGGTLFGSSSLDKMLFAFLSQSTATNIWNYSFDYRILP